jgi:hypothetical protein
MRTFAVAFTIISSLVAAGNVICLSNTTSDEVKAKCRQEKRDLFYENQFIDYLARQGR